MSSIYTLAFDQVFLVVSLSDSLRNVVRFALNQTIFRLMALNLLSYRFTASSVVLSDHPSIDWLLYPPKQQSWSRLPSLHLNCVPVISNTPEYAANLIDSPLDGINQLLSLYTELYEWSWIGGESTLIFTRYYTRCWQFLTCWRRREYDISIIINQMCAWNEDPFLQRYLCHKISWNWRSFYHSFHACNRPLSSSLGLLLSAACDV